MYEKMEYGNFKLNSQFKVSIERSSHKLGIYNLAWHYGGGAILFFSKEAK